MNSNQLTVLYCTSNREDESFEKKIRGKLLEVIGDHPLISVSQKPIDFGHNICVGDVGSSYRNWYIQLHMAAKLATTEYVAVAEADQLYPPGYFDFHPQNDLYMNRDLWVLKWWDKNHFRKKEWGDATVIVRRSFFISRLELKLDGNLNWGTSKVGTIFYKRTWNHFDAGAPVITVKTKNNISKNTGTMEGVEPVTKLPYWGSAAKLSQFLNL